MKNSNINFFEILVLIAIILVTIFTFFDDFAVFTGLSAQIQTILMIIGFCFDFFFAIEFLTRLYYSMFDKGIGYYLVHGYGWVDFCASIPLLMFSSGPNAVIYFLSATGAKNLVITTAFLSLLKLIKIIRIARVLRLLRILKIFKTIKYTDTRMAQRHVSKIITIGVTVVVFVLFLATFVLEFTDLRKLYDPTFKNKEVTFDLIEKKITSQKELVQNLKSLDALHNVLLIAKNNKTIYSRTTPPLDIGTIPVQDYSHLSRNGLDVFFDIRAENERFSKNQAKDFLVFYFIILFLIIVFLILYSPHFALTITDPIKIMKRGMEERDYNLEVRIPSLFSTDEVYELAKQYNEQYLPMKDRNRGTSPLKLDLSKEDMNDIFELGSDDD